MGCKLKYLKKNTESNISNQALSFLCYREKSELVLQEICRSLGLNHLTTIPRFYSLIQLVKKEKKKYFNKIMLLQLSTPSEDHPVLRLMERMGRSVGTEELQNFCKLCRSVLKVFFDEYCIPIILTSKKMDREGMVDHLGRRRQIKEFLQKGFSMYDGLSSTSGESTSKISD